MPGIELQSSLCAVALLLTLMRRFGVEPHVFAAVSLITDGRMTMEVASETSDFYTLLRRLIELENLPQQAIRVVIYSGRNMAKPVLTVAVLLNYKLCRLGCDRCLKHVWWHDTPGTQNLGRD
jgi:hypothetical protein